jgi:HlyD family secretion protein
LPWRIVGLVALLAVVAGGFFVVRGSDGAGASAGSELLFTVPRGDLRITVVESGSLESENSIDIKCELEGRVQILRLVEEGTFARKGDLLVELDAADLVEREISQEINYERALASFVQAKKNFEIEQSNGESDIKQAELTLEFAGKDLEKFRDGDMPQDLLEANNNIRIAEEELKRARDKRDWSAKLAEKGYITRQELEADTLAVTKREVDLELAKERLRVLDKYTHPKELKRLQSDLEEAGKNLDRVRKRVEGQMAQAEADLKAKEATEELEKERLEKLRDQIGKAKLYAPQDGLVVYNNQSGSFGRSNQEPIEEGATVRERQTIIILPDVTQMIAKIKIHESSYDRVSEGQQARVTLDAFPGRVFPSVVSFVAPLPDSQQWWMNPDLKVYSAEVQLGNDTTMLKPGMSCSVEIEVENLEDVLYVPIQSVFREGSTTYCYVRTSSGVVAKPVDVGLHNDRLIHIVDGVEEGDRVFLAPPANADEIEVPVVVDTESSDAAEEFPEIVPRRKRSQPGDRLEADSGGGVPEGAGEGERGGRRFGEGRRGERGPDGRDGSERRARSGGEGVDFQAMMNMSPEDRQKAMQDFMNKSPEEQAEIRERMMRAFSEMSQEDRDAMMKRFQQGGGGAPGGGRPGGGDDGGR